MSRLNDICKTKLDRGQLQLGNCIVNELLNQGKKVKISYTNLNYAKGKGFTIRVYLNEYDYKEYNLKYLPDTKVEEYFNCISCMDRDKSYRLHKSTADERYLIDILELQEINYHIDGDFLYIGDDFNENAIDTTEIEELHYNKSYTFILISQEDGTEIKLDLANERIIYTENEEDEELEKAEIITIDFIKRLVSEFNKLNYWCSLVFKDNSIYIVDKETNNLQELIDIDDIDIIKLKDNKLSIEFIDEDENGFNCCLIDKKGIQY